MAPVGLWIPVLTAAYVKTCHAQRLYWRSKGSEDPISVHAIVSAFFAIQFGVVRSSIAQTRDDVITAETQIFRLSIKREAGTIWGEVIAARRSASTTRRLFFRRPKSRLSFEIPARHLRAWIWDATRLQAHIDSCRLARWYRLDSISRRLRYAGRSSRKSIDASHACCRPLAH